MLFIDDEETEILVEVAQAILHNLLVEACRQLLWIFNINNLLSAYDEVGLCKSSNSDVAYLSLHVFYFLFEEEEFFAEVVLVVAEVLGVLLHPLEECLVVVDGLVDAFFVFGEISLVDELEVI